MSSPPFLHKLPPEMRNIIYRLALVRNERVFVSNRASVEPGLLRVCRTIREETGPIFFGANHFGIDMNAGCPSALFWSRKVASVRKEFRTETTSIISLTLLDSLDALMDWCKVYHSEPSYVWLYARETEGDPDSLLNEEMKIIAAMLATAKALTRWPWADVEGMLEGFTKELHNVSDWWQESDVQWEP